MDCFVASLKMDLKYLGQMHPLEMDSVVQMESQVPLLEFQKGLVHLYLHAGNLPTSILHDSSLCIQASLIWNQVLQQADYHL
uniref:Uncharacterized protein n=1 Tax=Arundo donax TaxID=35708 RepID=A0A0A9DY27_ARUDO